MYIFRIVYKLYAIVFLFSICTISFANDVIKNYSFSEAQEKIDNLNIYAYLNSKQVNLVYDLLIEEGEKGNPLAYKELIELYKTSQFIDFAKNKYGVMFYKSELNKKTYESYIKLGNILLDPNWTSDNVKWTYSIMFSSAALMDMAEEVRLCKKQLKCNEFKSELNELDIYNKGLEILENSLSIGDYEAKKRIGFSLGESYSHNTSYNNDPFWEKNYFKAKKYYEISAEAGNIESMLKLAQLYEDGLGVRQSKVNAKEQYGRACDAQNQQGCDNYKRLNSITYE